MSVRCQKAKEKERQKSTLGEQTNKQIHNYVVTEMYLRASRQVMLQKFICKSASHSAHFYLCGERGGGIVSCKIPRLN